MAFDKTTVKQAARGQWPDILSRVAGIDPAILDGQNHPCPKCGGVDRFRLIDEREGACLCNQCFSERNGDGFSAVQWMLGCDFPKAVTAIGEHLGITDHRGTPSPGARPEGKPTDPGIAPDGVPDDFGKPPPEERNRYLAAFCESKPPITPEAVIAAGGIAVSWPKKFSGDKRCIAWPAVDDHGNRRGWILRRVNGEEFAARGKRKARKAHVLTGSGDGWIVPGGWERVRIASIVWKVEGLPDALALYPLLPNDHAVVTNICGAKSVPPFLDPFKGKAVAIVPDADQPGVAGANKYAAKLGRMASNVRIAPLPFPVTEDHGKDLRDWLNEGGTFDQLQALADEAEAVVPGEVDPNDDGRPEIEIETDEYRVIDQTVAALAADPDLYVQGDMLATILHGGGSPDGILRPENTARIATLEWPTVRERITRFARLVKLNAKEEPVPVHPPQWLPLGVLHRGHWPRLRHIAGIVATPVLRLDGSVLSAPGYDSATRLFFDPAGMVIDVPENPTRHQSQDAAAELLELFSDFPFEAEYHQSAVLALILTGFSRHAFHGPAPLFLIDANVRGSGKSLLADAVGLILTGSDLPRMSYPKNDEETGKRITSLVVRGDQICLIDNIAGELGGASLDAALTGTTWRDRILGGNKIIDLPLSVTWLATGNNVSLVADTSRRVCHIRLNCPEERPEERTGFAQPDLRGHILANRPKLVRAALMILRGYFVAGRPEATLSGWGSYEGWTSVVRQAIVWLGMPDPAAGRVELMEQSDTEAAAKRQLLECWYEIDPDGRGITTNDLLERLAQSRDYYPGVRGAILNLCGGTISNLPDVRKVGNKFRQMRGQVIGGRKLDAVPNRNKVNAWRVVESEQPMAASGGSVRGLGGHAGSFHAAPTLL